MDVLQKIEDNDPFFALDVPGMKEDIIISCSIMEKKNQNKKRPDKKISFYLYTFKF